MEWKRRLWLGCTGVSSGPKTRSKSKGEIISESGQVDLDAYVLAQASGERDSMDWALVTCESCNRLKRESH